MEGTHLDKLKGSVKVLGLLDHFLGVYSIMRNSQYGYGEFIS